MLSVSTVGPILKSLIVTTEFKGRFDGRFLWVPRPDTYLCFCHSPDSDTYKVTFGEPGVAVGADGTGISFWSFCQQRTNAIDVFLKKEQNHENGYANYGKEYRGGTKE
mgnify:CR=1 FL=1